MAQRDYLDDIAAELDHDAVASLHDTEAEAGDDGELADVYSLDRVEARELGVALDSVAADEPLLD